MINIKKDNLEKLLTQPFLEEKKGTKADRKR